MPNRPLQRTNPLRDQVRSCIRFLRDTNFRLLVLGLLISATGTSGSADSTGLAGANSQQQRHRRRHHHLVSAVAVIMLGQYRGSHQRGGSSPGLVSLGDAGLL